MAKRTRMSVQPQESGIDGYWRAIQVLQAKVIQSQRDLLERVAQAMAETIQGGRRIFVFGTGHSHMLAEEAHFRAGGGGPPKPHSFSLSLLPRNPPPPRP